MSHSLNEIEALAKRAARGAGFSWGMAEETAKATRWLASHDLAGPALLSDLLIQNDGLSHQQVAPVRLTGKWQAPKGDLCPLAAGTALNDCADQLDETQPILMANISFPLMVLPFAAWAALHINRPIRVSWSDLQIDTDGHRIWMQTEQDNINTNRATALTCHIAKPRKEHPRNPATRGTVAPEIWDTLGAFAQRTYAPATDASRLLGAGSGVSDND